MGFKPYWDVFKLSRFRKELFGQGLHCDLFDMLTYASTIFSAWEWDTNTLLGPISRSHHCCTW